MATFYDNVVLDKSPIVYWRASETTGATLDDIGTNNLDGSYTPYSGSFTGGTQGVASVVPGDGGLGVTLNGSTGYLLRTGNATISGVTTAWSIGMWIKPAASITRAGLFTQQFVTTIPWILGVNIDGAGAANRVDFGFYTGAAWRKCQDPNVIASGTTYFFVGTWDGTTLRLYRNGALVNSTTPIDDPVAGGTRDVYIGRNYDSTNYFNGSLARPSFFNTALSADDVSRMYNAMASAPASGGIILNTPSMGLSTTQTIKVFGVTTGWIGGSSPITVSAGTINSQTVNATDQIVTIDYTSPSTAQAVTFTNTVSSTTTTLPVRGTASGQVELLGSVIASTVSNPSSNATDNNFTTFWTPSGATGAWIGYDLGAAVACTKTIFTPRPSGLDGNHENKAQGSVIQGATDAAFTSPTTYDTIPGPTGGLPFYPRFQYNERPIVGASAFRYWRFYNAGATGAGQLAELKFYGPHSAGLTARPARPVMSPWGGRFRNQNATCTISCETTSAQIYYTTDNSPPTNTNGTLYTGPFAVDTTEESITVKAVAYDYSCTTPLSLVIEGHFHRYGYTPRADWYDDRGILIEAHSGHILKALGKYWWYGSLMNTHSNGDNTANFGVFLYSSTDMYNWKFEGHILDAINGGIDFTGIRIIRMHVIYNASTRKYVLWSHEQFPSDKAGIATADHPAGPWTWVTVGYLPGGRGYKDCNLFQDDDGTAYTVFTNETQTNMNIFQLSPDYLTATGGGILVNAGLGREGHAPFKCNGVYFMINSRGNYYDSNGLTFDLKYQTSTTGMLGTWSALAPAFGAPTETLGTDYNVQPTQVMKVGKHWMLIADYWVGGPDDNPPTNQLYHSRQVWLPITFPTPTTLEIQRPAEWGYTPDDVAGFRNRTRNRLIMGVR